MHKQINKYRSQFLLTALAFWLGFPQLCQATYSVPPSESNEGYKSQWRGLNTSLNKEFQATQTNKDPNQSPASDQYAQPGDMKYAGTTPRPGGTFNFNSGPAPANWKDANASQQSGTSGSILHTIYGTNFAKPGPPSGPPPWLIMHPKMASLNINELPMAATTNQGPQTNMAASDTQNFLATLGGAQRGAERTLNPELGPIKSGFQGFTQEVGDAAASAQHGGFQALMPTFSLALINVANEESGSPAGPPPHTIPNAVWIVNQMYNRFYVPLAILLLLVGAVLTQAGNTVKNTVAPYALMEQPDAFQGIIRGFSALVLMAMVPLIVSWGIDIGNSLTYTVTQAIQMETLTSWFNDVSPDNSQQPQGQKDQQDMDETPMAAGARAIFSCVATFLTYGIMVLVAYQLAIVCYLYLLGPIAAAFYAWPGGIGSLFKPVFNNWLNALTNLVLWRFWWCVILLCMVVRVNWLKDIGMYDPQSQWEPLVYTAFLVMLAYVPFHALDFRPGDLVDRLLEKAKVGQQSGGGSAPT